MASCTLNVLAMSRTALPSASNLRGNLRLVRIELARPAEPDPTLFCRFPTGPGPLADQSRSNSAIPAKTVMIILPACVVVLAHGSEIDWNLPPASLIVSIVLSRSRVDLARRSSISFHLNISESVLGERLEILPAMDHRSCVHLLDAF